MSELEIKDGYIYFCIDKTMEEEMIIKQKRCITDLKDVIKFLLTELRSMMLI